ncbi:LysM peptidoglycan-binding domain-containing protein [Bacillus sp. FSL K6-4563]|uniref:LysM peptidoglycan-binding domain-containing protein n=1 Tax=Bacillus TaxID=1386 RepID=UPI00017A66B1|nr:LysM peptidoglycan-binding domain-containing protein [Bacillus pumilus]EDW20554.1 stage VI sporulation protein D [Bacillus pumilus ATCC 7061]MCR4353317.1 LysM peptidoglycan-binding domain-containing protein [Bacillus pumilus]MCY7500890.1 LysM peptidoglycan-binding domain-containing protein [Bacillus pumilus]MCY7505246.1 LysM peptidoglycan-binding domain-containing protein [Bacillus pumilus]MCY7526324.1 LysM peptidoglycan-binding domain-containing protein [Bacillus pumilus]
MSQNNRLQFSVEESIYFKSGQEVSELLSISLDPDILVQEVNDYVSIRGSLELTGEYNINQEELLGELSSYASYREADEVKVREDGTAELLHQFPVDITIPKNKISHLNDVFVFIDAFDYQLTENRLLTIQADLAIEGLLDEEMPQVPVEEPYEFVHRSEEEYGDVTYDYQLQPEDEEQEELQDYEREIDEDQAVLQHDTRAEEEKQEEEIEIELVSREEETEELEESESQEEVALGYRSLPEAQVQEPPFFEPPKLLEEEKREDTFFEVEVRKDPEAAEELEETVQPYPVFESPAYHVEEEQEAQDDTYQLGRLYEREAPKVYESAQEEEEFEEDVRETSGSENSLYLTKLFAKQEEEDFSRMKICIVQQEDTVDRICERYQLNVQQLLRTNSLSVDAELEEGQILYIPEYQKSNA